MPISTGISHTANRGVRGKAHLLVVISSHFISGSAPTGRSGSLAHEAQQAAGQWQGSPPLPLTSPSPHCISCQLSRRPCPCLHRQRQPCCVPFPSSKKLRPLTAHPIRAHQVQEWVTGWRCGGHLVWLARGCVLVCVVTAWKGAAPSGDPWS